MKKGEGVECKCIPLRRLTSLPGEWAFRLSMMEREDMAQQAEDFFMNNSLRESVPLKNLVGSFADPAFVIEVFIDQCHEGMTC